MTGSALVTAVLAHQGGWDEILLVAIPIALLAGLLWLANKRATAIQAARQAEEATSLPTSSSDHVDERP